ncbi:P-loop NTPase fold protein [Variovorax sp. tm]|uniref:P-loop NTPase fold protein n=1 Tax=Variovorax atrisoli TaxID=3394203 RepID=UPI003A81068D
MAKGEGKHAWLFQYRVIGETEWLAQLQLKKQVDWRIVRWARETAIDDLVFFWESGKVGGLRGWGLVNGEPFQAITSRNRTVWRVPVEVLHWLEKPISRSTVLAAGVFRSDNLYLTTPQGANFRLEPDEAERMLTAIPDTPIPFKQLQNLVPHSTRQEESERISDPGFGNDDESEPLRFEHPEEAGESSDTVYDIDQAFRSNHFTSLTYEVLNEARFRNEKLVGPISSTRLFLALCDVATLSPLRDMAGGDEKAALEVVSAVVALHREEWNLLRTNYLREQDRGRPSPKTTITHTVRRILEHARGGNLEKSGMISVDALVLSMFTVDAGRLSERLESVGLSLRQIKMEISHEVHSGSEVFSEKLHRLRGRSRVGASSSRSSTIGLQVPRVRNDNPWQEGQKDVLGAEREAQAFAALTLSPHFIPPLAIGVFGEWGAGKSFFMRLVHENVKRLADQARAEGTQAPLLGRVVQIRFNAWHYVDTNLWASLVDHIFTELDRATSTKQRSKSEQLFEQLATARELTLESAETLVTRRKEQEAAALAVAESERRLGEAEHRANLSPERYWEAIKKDFLSRLENSKAELVTAADRLGLSSLETDIRPFAQALEQLEDSRQKATVLADGIKRQLGSWWMVGCFALACIVAPAVIWCAHEALANVFIRYGHDIRGAISEWTVWTSGVLAAGAGVFAEASRRVRNAITVVQSFREKFEKTTAHVLAQPSLDLEEHRKELARLSAEVEEGKSRLAASTERLSQAARDYNTGTGRARLLGFVRARAAGESYVRHLGLVATIRKDFEELSELIAAAVESGAGASNPTSIASEELQAYTKRVESLISYATADNQQLLRPEEQSKLRDTSKAKPLEESDSIDRIVLYIDDLDRCQPEKVAEVLQAVHLLLSFKLFVVFVAVDVRWVSRALLKHYPMLDEKSGKDGGATAHDYLEKIFQVPYWVRPMTDGASADFVRDLLAQPQRMGQPSTPSTTFQTPPPAGVTQVIAPSSVGTRVETLEKSPYPVASLKSSVLSEHPVDQLEALASQLELGADERELMVDLAHCAGDSPRRLLRFLNVYQVAKASLRVEHEQAELELLMTQIAISTGAPDLGMTWAALLSAAPKFAAIDGILERVNQAQGVAVEQRDRIASALSILKSRQPDVDASELLRYIEIAGRYSFTGIESPGSHQDSEVMV